MLLKILKFALFFSVLGVGIGIMGLFDLEENPDNLLFFALQLGCTILLYSVISLIKQVNTNSTDIKLLKEEIAELRDSNTGIQKNQSEIPQPSTTETDNKETEN